MKHFLMLKLSSTSVIALLWATAASAGSNPTLKPHDGGVGPTSVTAYAGVDCTGATDSSAGLATAGVATPYLTIPENCTLIVDNWALPATINLVGAGPSSVVKHKNSATAHMLTQANANSKTTFRNLTIDGNFQNNGGDGFGNQTWASLRLTAGSTSASSPAIVVLDNVTFVNGGFDDEDTFWSAAAYPIPTIWQESNTRHLGGADGYKSASFSAPMDAYFSSVDMDFLRTPSGPTMVGRGGIIFFSGSDLTGGKGGDGYVIFVEFAA